MFLLNFRRLTWQRAGIALLLALLATSIVKPYFLPVVTFGQLLMRMAVTATVMPLAPMLAAYRERSASDESADLATVLEELSQRLGLPTRNTCVGLRPVSARPYGCFPSKMRSIFSPTKNIPASCWRIPKS